MAMRVGEAAFRRQQNAIILCLDLRRALESTEVPTLVGVGDSDLITPLEEAMFIRTGIPHSHFHFFRDCGHFPPAERADEMSTLVPGWLRPKRSRSHDIVRVSRTMRTSGRTSKNEETE